MNPAGGTPLAPARRFTFRKTERLCSRRLLDGLFRHGTAFNAYPLRFVCWQTEAGTVVSGHPTPSVQVVLSVSKRYFKRAHDRNRIKRLLREAWRHHKPDFGAAQLPAANPRPLGPLLLAVLYIGKEKPASLDLLTRRLRKGIDRLRAELPAAPPVSAE